MTELKNINYEIDDPSELNRSYMPFIKEGGLFIPSSKNYTLGEKVRVTLRIPNHEEPLTLDGQVIWITPKHALHLALPGFGIQLSGENAKTILNHIHNALDTKTETGGYTYWLDEDIKT